MFYPLIGMPQGAEWLVILAIVVLVFGASKLPDLARGTGQALRIFKSETKELREDDKDEATPPPPVPPAAELSPPPAAPAPTEPVRSEDPQPDQHDN